MHQNAEMHQRQASLNGALLEICSSAPANVETERPLDSLAKLACEQLRADLCDIWSFDKTTNKFIPVGATSDTLRTDDPPRDDGWSNHVKNVQKAVVLENLKAPGGPTYRTWNTDQNAWGAFNDSDILPTAIHPAVDSLNIYGEIGLPILLRDECIAVAWLKYRQGDRLQEATLSATITP